MNTHFKNRHNFSCPVMDDDTEDMYILLYGIAGMKFCEVLSKPPYEIAVISRLLAYLDLKKHCKQLGVPTDFYKNPDRYSMDGNDLRYDFDCDPNEYGDEYNLPFEPGFVSGDVDNEPSDIEKYLAKSDRDLFEDDENDAESAFGEGKFVLEDGRIVFRRNDADNNNPVF